LSYLLDTNIISEIRKGSGCNPQVAKWFAAIDADDIYLSVLAIGEIRKGIERARPKDATRARALERWLETVLEAFNGHIVPIDHAIAG
jgi:predicted nucleic acid-binding protein